MSSRAWWVELWRLLGVTLPAGLLGFAVGAPGWLLAAALLLLLGWHARQAARLLQWLRVGAKSNRAPLLGGLWGEYVEDIERRQEWSRQRRDRLEGMLERFQRTAEALPDGAVVLGPNHEIEWANRAARRLLGIDSTGDQGTRIQNLLRDPRVFSYLHTEDRGDDDSVDIPSPMNPRIELNVRVIPYGEGQHLLMARDVSNLRRLETVRRDFVANVSHELRTPLTVIRGYAESCTDEELPESVQDGIAAISRQAARMQAIVEDLLTLSRLELDPVDPDAAEWVAVADLLPGMVRDAQSLSVERGHELTLEADAAIGLRATATELNSAFGNLINNAVQHTPAGTAIRVVWARERGGAVLRVEDDGEGIAPEHLPRITERFYRADPGRSRASGGTGLGLALVKHAVARNGGRLEIDSEPGEGAVFACHFPSERVIDFGDFDAESAPAGDGAVADQCRLRGASAEQGADAGGRAQELGNQESGSNRRREQDP